MKNNFPSSEYLPVTSTFEALKKVRPPWTSESRIETIDGFGETPIEIYYLDADHAALAKERAGKPKQGIEAKLRRIGELIPFSLTRVPSLRLTSSGGSTTHRGHKSGTAASPAEVDLNPYAVAEDSVFMSGE